MVYDSGDAGGGRRLSFACHRYFFVSAREEDLHHGARARPTIQPNITVALFDDSVNGGQTEPRSLVRGLGLEERLEDSSQGLPVHAHSGIAHRQRHIRTGSHVDRTVVGVVQLNVPGLDAQLAPFRHGVPGVDREVHDDLLDLAAIRLDATEAGLELRHELDVLANESCEHLVHLEHDLVEVQHPRRENLPPAEGEKLACERCRAIGGLLHLLDILTSAGPPHRSSPRESRYGRE